MTPRPGPPSPGTAIELVEPGPTAAARHEALARAVSGAAVDRVLGSEVAPEVRRELAAQLAPWAERLVWLLDDFLRIPGTNVRIGLDPILGLIPGVGDVITGTGSIALLLLALRERIPTVAIGRMVMNILVDVLGGAIPVVGDAFDVAWRSNRRNLEIIQRYRDDPKAEPTASDRALVGVGIGLAVLSVALPFAIGAIFGVGVWSLFSG